MKALRLLVIGIIASAAGCAVGPNYRTPKPDAPAQFAANANAAGNLNAVGTASGPSAVTVDLAQWWKSLNDSELDSLVERAIRSNMDLDIALTHLQQAHLRKRRDRNRASGNRR